MFTDCGEPSSEDAHGTLYDVVATSTGVGLSACSERGHALVVNLMQHLGLSADARLPAVIPAVLPTPNLVKSTTVEARDALSSSLPNADSSATGPLMVTPSAPSEVHLGLSELIERHIKNLNRGGVKERLAVRERRHILDLLMQATGDKPVGDITEDDAEDLADLLIGWPAYRRHQTDLAHMSVRSIVARAKEQELPTIQKSTQSKHIKAINAFFGWVRPCRIDSAPQPAENAALLPPEGIAGAGLGEHPCQAATSLSVEMAGGMQGEVDAGGITHLILRSRVRAPTKSASSNGHMSGSSRCPTATVSSTTFFTCSSDAARSEKAKMTCALFRFQNGCSPSSSRGIFWASMPSARRTCFRAFGRARGQPGGTIESWVNGKLRTDWVILDKDVTFHCFRHTISNLMRNARTPLAIRRALMAHSRKPRPGSVPSGNSVAEEHYEDVVTPLDILLELDRLPFPELDVALYERPRSDDYLMQEGVRRRSNELLVAAGKAHKPKRGPLPKAKSV